MLVKSFLGEVAFSPLLLQLNTGSVYIFFVCVELIYDHIQLPYNSANSTCVNTCMQLFVSDKEFVFVVSMKTQSEFPDALTFFAKRDRSTNAANYEPFRETIVK